MYNIKLIIVNPKQTISEIEATLPHAKFIRNDNGDLWFKLKYNIVTGLICDSIAVYVDDKLLYEAGDNKQPKKLVIVK